MQLWLFDRADIRIEGIIIGFDEYMNMVLDQAVLIHVKKETRESVGRMLLKGDNISLIQEVSK